MSCAAAPIRAATACLAMALLLLPSAAVAANPDLDTVLNGSRQRLEKLDYRATGRLTRLEGDGKRTNYKFVARAHWFPDGLRVLFEIAGPAAGKTSFLLRLTPAGRMTIETRPPGQDTATALPFDHWNDPILGTDFSYEDMAESAFFWKNQQLLPPQKYGARDCFVLKSLPGPEDRSHYDSVTSSIDRTILFPVHVVKTIRGTGQQKEFIAYGLRQVGGAWSATQLETKQQGNPGSSLLVIEGGSANAKLTLKDFNLSPTPATR